MAWKFNLAGETLSGASRLKVGTHNYKIKSFKPEVDKADPTGKKQKVVLELTQGSDYTCKVYFDVMSDNEMVANIADKTIRSIVLAAGVKQLPSCVGKVVSITGVEKPGTGKNADKTFVNILKVEAFSEDSGEEEEEEEAPNPKAEAKAPEPAEEEEEEEEEAEEEEEKPATKPRTRPW